MSSRAWRLLACSSLLLAVHAATRPHYGGTLRVQLTAIPSRLDGEEAERVLAAVGDTLVTLGSKGEVKPRLATEWQHDASWKRWRFHIRPHVPFHDTSILTAADVAESLKASLALAYPDASASASGEWAAIELNHSDPSFPAELAMPAQAIVKRSASNTLVGTGPFRLAAFQPGARISCAAFDEYWDARPFLDAVEFSVGAADRASADIVELTANVPARSIGERHRIWTTAPIDLVALHLPETRTEVRQALAAAVDRAPIVSVLAQRRGEPAGGLLPDWLSGYGFTFPIRPDSEAARRAASAVRDVPVVIGYAHDDSFLRLIAERILLNAREAGLNAKGGNPGDSAIRLVRIRVGETSAQAALNSIARGVGLDARLWGSVTPQAVYDFERSLLQEGSILPVMLAPEVYAIGERVRNWDAAANSHSRQWRLETVWLMP